jgi:REP element-mobilizing transposase RayT
MPTNNSTQNRRSIRLAEYDYTQPGAYFITICAHERACVFGDIVGDEMRLNDAGWMVQQCWDEIPEHYPGIDIDAFTVMPNHIHGIVILVGATPRGCPVPTPQIRNRWEGQAQGPAPTANTRNLSLPDVVHRLKSLTTRRYADGVKHHNWPPFNKKLWQRNYYEHIIRDEEDLRDIRDYIQNNPLRWADDDLHP